jgi:uncharacterized heparinase superfamily protein
MGKTMQWRPPGVSALWVYTLHYFGWLKDLRALPGDDGLFEARRLVESWITDAGDFDRTLWHPYPLSLRLVNWLTHADWLMSGADVGFKTAFMTSLVKQANHLPKVLEWDVGGNHLLKNIKALVYTGLCLPSRQSTYLEGVDLLDEQLAVQILPDGAHYERSPHYHADVLEDLLDIHALILRAGQKPSAALDEAIEKMAVALAFYRHPDGGLALFNDGETGNPDHLDALLDRCGLAGDVPSELPYAGYMRLARGGTVVFMDTGLCCPDSLPAHAHADTLSIELSIGTERVVVNGGTYAYQHELRNTLRGTAAHSTVCLNRQDSAEVWGTFRLGRRPRRVVSALREEPGLGIGVEASHDGYRHIGAKHFRRLFLSADGRDLRGEDVIDAKTTPYAVAHFHLAPGVKVALKSPEEAELTTPLGAKVHVRVKGGQMSETESRYSPSFGLLVPTRQLTVRGQWDKDGKCVLKWGLRLPA